MSLCSLAAWAYDFSAVAPSGQRLYYNIISGSTVSVTYPGTYDVPYHSPYDGYGEPTGALIIPTTVTINNQTYSVTSIGSHAFDGCRGLTSVTIPNSVTSIGSYAFPDCRGLTTITIPNSVTSIEDYTFINCSGLTSVTIGNSVTTIGICAFDGCYGLTSVTIPNSVTSIGQNAFYGCQGLTSITIGNSVTTIGIDAFGSCRGLTSVTIPNSVTSIGVRAFSGCSGLTTITIGNSVTSIGFDAFACNNLIAVYNLSNLSITNSDYGLNANRVVNCTEHSGSGDNIIYKIPTSFTIVNNNASTSSTQIPYSAIPTNFIYHDNGAKDGGGWKAKNIVLTDGQDAFESPETFTAETATYTRVFTNSHRSTLYLPFTAATPSNLEVYEFSGFDGSTLYFSEHTTGVIDAYTPYLVGYGLEKSTTKCVITKTNAVFPATAVATPAYTTTHGGMTFKGTLARTGDLSTNNYGYKDGFFVRSGGAAHVNPFRCYFTYSGGAPSQMPPHTLSVAFGDGPLAIDAVEAPATNGSIRYSNDVYDLMGRLVRKDAVTLDGLPTGIYIWKGRKVLAR